jgi:hypothetical protein
MPVGMAKPEFDKIFLVDTARAKGVGGPLGTPWGGGGRLGREWSARGQVGCGSIGASRNSFLIPSLDTAISFFRLAILGPATDVYF